MITTAPLSSPVSVWVWKNYDQLPSVYFAKCMQNFSDSEKHRISNIRSAARWREYIAGHHLLRTMLKTLYINELTRDMISHQQGYPPSFADTTTNLHFNISHSSGVIICIISQVGNVGIDIEKPKKTRNIDGIADTYFSKREADLINTLQAEQKRMVFYPLWTLKESLMKAMAKGINEEGMRTEFILSTQQLFSHWYSYSFVYEAHYGAISLPCSLNNNIDVAVYELDMALNSLTSLSLIEYTPQH